MNTFNKIALRCLTAISGVFLACAYGFRYSWDGIVKDSQTKAPVQGIRVTCDQATPEGHVQDITDAAGHFQVGAFERCENFVFEDSDGEANGAYQSKTVESLKRWDNVIELDPANP